jgi:hypothetical protein
VLCLPEPRTAGSRCVNDAELPKYHIANCWGNQPPSATAVLERTARMLLDAHCAGSIVSFRPRASANSSAQRATLAVGTAAQRKARAWTAWCSDWLPRHAHPPVWDHARPGELGELRAHPVRARGKTPHPAPHLERPDSGDRVRPNLTKRCEVILGPLSTGARVR